MKTIIKIVCCVLIVNLSALAANYAVKSNGGGNFTTIQSCASAMSPGDTCTVYAGTYNENVTVSAGTTGNYKTITVNGSDVVKVYSFTLNSHTKLIGNCPEPASASSCGFNIIASSPLNASCVTLPSGTTDVYITSNYMASCGSAGSPSIIQMYGYGSAGVSYVYVTGNTLTYGCGTAAAPDNCSGINFNGDHVLIQNNDLSHLGLAIQTFAQYTVLRNNTIHDMSESECGAQSGNCHLDIIYAERGVNLAGYNVQYQLWEGNTGNTVTGVDGKGLWTAADNPGGCSTNCFNVIGRFNVLAHFGSGVMSQTSGFMSVKYYNNTVIDPSMSAHGSPSTSGPYLDGSSTGGASINNLYYYPFSFPTGWGWYVYSTNSSGDTGFTAGANLAYCSSSPCGVQTLRNGSTIHAFTSDTPVIASNILASSDPLASYSGGNFNLAAGSPALNAGTHLTTVAAGDSGSGTSLVVTDAGFFQDGLGLKSAGVQADCISVSTVGNQVCINSVNYATNTLTLASGITRSPGDPVWLYSDSQGKQVLVGSAPNIGATFSGPPAPTNLSAVVN